MSYKQTPEATMTDDTQPIRATVDAPAKKPYEPPRILSRESLETVAGVCTTYGKANPIQCPAGPINS